MNEFHNSVASEEPSTKMVYFIIPNTCHSIKTILQWLKADQRDRRTSGATGGCNGEVENFMMRKKALLWLYDCKQLYKFTP